MQKEIVIFSDDAGKQPFIAWLEKLDSTSRSRIHNRIIRLELGNYGDHKLLQGGVYELRMHFGPGYRVYFGEDGNKIVVLICGGNKQTQQKDIKCAIHYWQQYMENKK